MDRTRTSPPIEDYVGMDDDQKARALAAAWRFDMEAEYAETGSPSG